MKKVLSPLADKMCQKFGVHHLTAWLLLRPTATKQEVLMTFSSYTLTSTHIRRTFWFSLSFRSAHTKLHVVAKFIGSMLDSAACRELTRMVKTQSVTKLNLSLNHRFSYNQCSLSSGWIKDHSKDFNGVATGQTAPLGWCFSCTFTWHWATGLLLSSAL